MNALHEKALQYAKEFKRGERNLVSILIEVDDKKVFLEMGYPSLFSYCVKALDLGESYANLVIWVARKAKEIPEMRELPLSKAKELVTVITPENKTEWIGKAQSLSQRNLQREVAKTKPERTIRETVKPVTPTKSELRVGISHEIEENLEKLKDLLGCSLEEVLKVVTKEYLERHDPLKKAERRRTAPPKPAPSKRLGRRVPVRASIRHEVNVRDKRQCTYLLPDGSRCEQKRWLQMHHKRPVHAGGLHSVENLTILCASHHRYLHPG